MTRPLEIFGRLVTRAPMTTLVALVVITLALGAAATTLEVETSLDGFAPDDGVAATLDEIDDRFSTTDSVQVLIDDGPGGDVVDLGVLADVVELERRLSDDPDIAPVLPEASSTRPAVVSFALPFELAAEAAGTTVDELDDAVFDGLATAVLDNGGDQVAALFSADLITDPAQARSGLVVVDLDARAPAADRAEAARAIERIVDETPVGDARRSVLSMTAIEDGVEASFERDLPVLLSLSVFLVMLVLALMFRSVVDVLVVFVGLLASIVWMVGIAALLGPGNLGWTGPFNQISIAVPVLLVGLGIDYSVHLTTRYREQRRAGDTAARASQVTLFTVGIALVLATIATVVGFLANTVTPLAPIRDFGIFAAIGMVTAFVVLMSAVPAVRTMVDRRRDARRSAELPPVPVAGGAGPAPADLAPGPVVERARPTPPPRWSRALTTVATRRPGTALAVTGVLLVVGAVLAAGISTEFDERDFLPDGEPVLATLDRLDEQFGGNVGERTFVLVEGDQSDPQLLAAVADFEDGLADVDGVRTTGDRAEVVSPIELRDEVVRAGEAVRERLADDLTAWTDPQAAAEDVELPDPFDVAAFADDLDDAVELPDDLAAALSGRLPADRSAALALALTADPAQIEAEVREQLAEDLAADRPDGLDDATLDALAARDADELTLEVLADAGYPMDTLDGDDREQLERLDALEAVGAVDSTDGAVLVGHFDVLRDEVTDEFVRVADEGGVLLSVSTVVGEDGATRLVGDLGELAGPVEAAGGEVVVASDQLVNAEIIDELSAAQLLAIVISLVATALLLVTATWLGSRTVALGAIGIVPSVVALVVVLGLMRLIGLPFNALTATVASIAVGIGVPYGIHLTNRFREGMAGGMQPDEAVGDALTNTGPALIVSGFTTGLALAVLMLSSSTPLRQFGIVSTLMIAVALVGCLLVQPALLNVWGHRRVSRG